ncbi:PIN domain-containing protein [Halomonas pacifica]|uniref:PIN domain-containing protein n=1 Tax=Bisbaumannia pacifica TaxID=77098 RepID=UPI0023592E8D|nr:PIN domain-containing protein [Halomonas pacifica]MDC8802222.1 PIN domain-containing protein [Halomonas pacifica]
MAEKKDVHPDKVFLVEEILPDASGFFEDEPQGLEEAIGDADIVLDTNVLLIPYGAGASSLTEIAKVYAEIKERQRLFVPAQVAREFVKNRPNKLAQLYQGISDKISKLTVPESLSYPILESVEQFQELNGLISNLDNLKAELKASAKKVRATIKNWGWNDPVSQAYRTIFTRDLIASPVVDREKLLEEMLKRYEHSIPPGYKDASKPDAGIGDFLIWKTILHLGKEHKRSVVFISGDEKADWLHGAEGSGFLPRYELQAEFRRITEGHDLYIIPLSRLLELQKAEETSVAEIRTEEQRIRAATSVLAECPECENPGEYELTEDIGSSALPNCVICDAKFHLHRVRDGITVRRYKRPSRTSRERVVEIVECPYCEAENLKELGVSANSTGWCVCDDCGEKFPIHRRADGSVFVNATAGG